MTSNTRATFGSNIGMIFAAAGSAVGLGNVWRFPYETGNNGGAAFLLIYLGCIVLLGMPLMVSEFLIGRRTHANTAGAYEIMAPGSPWKWVGRASVLTAFLILCYYNVVAGWTLEYLFEAVTGGFTGKTPEEFTSSFLAFISHPWRPIMWLALFFLVTHLVIIRGVEEGIEKASKIMMPLLFILVIVLVGCSLSLPNSGKGVEFLLKPDFSKVTGKTFLNAMGQAFFSLSLGMGCLATYASYFDKKTNLIQTALRVCSIDTAVAVLAGFIIFPAAFSVGIRPDSGAGLVFITLPNVFQQAFGDGSMLSMVFAVMFYVLLALAALTSTISIHEVITAFLQEEFCLSRKRAATYVTLVCFSIGIASSLSLGPWKEYTVFGKSLFDFLDYFTAKIMLPVIAFFISLFMGWYLKRTFVEAEITNEGTLPLGIGGIIVFLLRYFAPVAIAFVFANEIGLFGKN